MRLRCKSNENNQFKQYQMNKIKSLLRQVNTIKKKNDEILDATGNRFNMFRICGVNHYENTHSAIIAERTKAQIARLLHR